MDYQKHLKILKETLELHKITPENIREKRMPFKEFPKQINNRVVYVFQSFAPFDRAPAQMIRQAGRYLPECREIKAEMGFFDLSKSFYCCRNHFITNKTI